MAKQLIGTTEVAHRLGLSSERVRQLANAGVLPVAHLTMDRTRFFDPAVIERVRKARAKQHAARTQVMAVN